MKKWICLAAALAAAGLLVRLPHPARDISKLKPVRVIYLYMERGMLHIQTDTDDHGCGHSLAEAAEEMKAHADGEIFLETAEFLLLDPQVPITPDFCDLLRPGCRISRIEEKADLEKAAACLAAHPPKTTLRHIRAGQ